MFCYIAFHHVFLLLLEINILLFSYMLFIGAVWFHAFWSGGRGGCDTKSLCMPRLNNTRKDFKHELTKSYKSCSPREWETKMDKRLQKDDCNIVTEYCASKEARVSSLVLWVYFCRNILYMSNLYFKGPCRIYLQGIRLIARSWWCHHNLLIWDVSPIMHTMRYNCSVFVNRLY